MIEIKGVVKNYDGVTNVVDNLNLTINDGEIVVLIGESGCGNKHEIRICIIFFFTSIILPSHFIYVL